MDGSSISVVIVDPISRSSRGDTGWIIFDPLTAEETARAALEFINAQLGELPVKAVADYHVDGPIPGKAVVLTHPSVLGALVHGMLRIDEAAALGLLAFSGSDAEAVRQTLLVGLRSGAGQPAATADTWPNLRVQKAQPLAGASAPVMCADSRCSENGRSFFFRNYVEARSSGWQSGR